MLVCRQSTSYREVLNVMLFYLRHLQPDHLPDYSQYWRRCLRSRSNGSDRTRKALSAVRIGLTLSHISIDVKLDRRATETPGSQISSCDEDNHCPY